MPRKLALFEFHIDHIKSQKHGGATNLKNLAYACGFCNVFKGTDLGTTLKDKMEIVRFFNPRTDIWQEHFEVIEGQILGVSDIGKATEKIFQFNTVERILERKLLIESSLVDFPK